MVVVVAVFTDVRQVDVHEVVIEVDVEQDVLVEVTSVLLVVEQEVVTLVVVLQDV